MSYSYGCCCVFFLFLLTHLLCCCFCIVSFPAFFVCHFVRSIAACWMFPLPFCCCVVTPLTIRTFSLSLSLSLSLCLSLSFDFILLRYIFHLALPAFWFVFFFWLVRDFSVFLCRWSFSCVLFASHTVFAASFGSFFLLQFEAAALTMIWVPPFGVSVPWHHYSCEWWQTI